MYQHDLDYGDTMAMQRRHITALFANAFSDPAVSLNDIRNFIHYVQAQNPSASDGDMRGMTLMLAGMGAAKALGDRLAVKSVFEAAQDWIAQQPMNAEGVVITPATAHSHQPAANDSTDDLLSTITKGNA